MASERGQALVSAGASAASGNYVTAAASLLKAFASGSGKTPSVLQGFDVKGSIGPQGFVGGIEAFDQKGNRWAATGETAYLQSLGRDILTAEYFPNPIKPADVDAFFADGGSVPYSFTFGNADNSGLIHAIQADLKAGITGALMNQNTVPMTPTGADVPAAAGAGAAAAQPAQQPVVVVDSGMGQLVPLIALGAVVYFVLKG